MNIESAQTTSSSIPPYRPQASRAEEIGERVLRETLTPLLLLDLVAHGDVAIVQRSLAAITGYDERTVAALLLDRGWIGLRAIYRAAGFEPRHQWAIQIALAALGEAGGSIEPASKRRHAERCLSRVLTGAQHQAPEDADEVLRLLLQTGGVAALPSG